MKRPALLLLFASLTATAAIAACGSGTSQDFSSSSTSSGSGGSTVTTSSTSTTSTPATGGTGGSTGDPVDAGSDAAWDGGLPFDCGGCTCDGATHMCLGWYGSGSPPPPPYGIDCNADGGPSNCVPIPPECLPDPTCTCIKTNSQYCGQCSAHDGGYHLDCPVP